MRRVTSRSLGALCAVVLLALPATVLATAPGQNGKIAFVSGKGGPPGDDSGADVYILDHPGGTALPLTTRPGQHRHPSWSPDLTKIAYALFNTATDEKVWIQVLADPSALPLRVGTGSSNVRDDRPSWSPDGKRIAYESEVTDGSGQMDILITTLGPGGPTINLTDTPTQIEGKPVWSPDGKTIYYSRRAVGGADDDIRKEASDNSQAVPSFVINSATAEYQAALSPDGTRMCYTRGAFGSAVADVYVVSLSDTSSPVDISDTDLGAYNCAWSPDGRTIAYARGTFANGALMSEPADDSGTATLLTTDTPNHFDGNPDWAPFHPALCQGKPATITGTDGKDALKGTNHRDVVAAFGGNDSVKGLGGGDLLCGGTGKDVLDGGKGNDAINGGPGTDTCIGGPGKDIKAGCER